MFPQVLADRIRSVLADAAVPAPEEIRVARPPRPEDGDYSSPVALRIAGRKARDLAEQLADALRGTDGIEQATVTGAGHLNVRFTPDDLAATARELARRTPGSGTAPGETYAELTRLLRGADALGVPEQPLDLGDLAAPAQRGLICVLAETAGIAHRKPELLSKHLAEITTGWQRVEAVQPILPKGDEIPTIRHSSGRLLAAATRATLGAVQSLP